MHPRGPDPGPRSAPFVPDRTGALRVAVAAPSEREAIYRLRCAVYAGELGQHRDPGDGRLTDELDAFNTYLGAWRRARLAGFVSITPPGHGRYSVDKYVSRARLPFPFDEALYEIRLLTVAPAERRGSAAALLIYAALRWVEASGGSRVVVLGRREVLPLYTRLGLLGTGLVIRSGAVSYEVLHSPVAALRAGLGRFAAALRRLERRVDWQLGFPFHPPAAAFHGGAFFETVGERFDHLERLDEVISADVLDAWFPPSPRAVAALRRHLPRLMRTSPPTQAGGLAAVIAERRGVRPEQVLTGAGSSDLIFLAFRQWLAPGARALVLDPTYGEYPHVMEQVLGVRVERLPLLREQGYRVDPRRLAEALGRGPDLAVIVNPNSPTGQHVPRETLEGVLAGAPGGTRVWVDETYVEYADPGASLERFAAASANVVVCKSLSKVYALSGLRAAYLCGPARLLEPLRPLTPPWAVSLLAQVAAVKALQDEAYYAKRWAQTRRLRQALARALRGLGFDVVPGCANFLLAHIPASGPTAAELYERCRRRGLFIRDTASMSARLGDRVIRVAVKDGPTNRRIAAILGEELSAPEHASRTAGEP